MDNRQPDLTHLLNEIYYDKDDSYGLNYFGRFLNKLEKYDFAEILACQAKFPLRYVLNFILSTPSLWINMSDIDWVRVMSVLNPRPKPFSREIDDAGYTDIHFLCKYIRVNAIEMFLQHKHFSNEDKIKLLQYSKKVSIFLFMNDLELEDLNGDYFVRKDVLDNVRLFLISTGKFSELTYTEDEIKNYIEKQLKIFSNLDE